MPARLVFRLVLTVIREVLAVGCLLAILVIVAVALEVIVAVLGIVIVSLVVVLGPERDDLDGSARRPLTDGCAGRPNARHRGGNTVDRVGGHRATSRGAHPARPLRRRDTPSRLADHEGNDHP